MALNVCAFWFKIECYECGTDYGGTGGPCGSYLPGWSDVPVLQQHRLIPSLRSSQVAQRDQLYQVVSSDSIESRDRLYKATDIT